MFSPQTKFTKESDSRITQVQTDSDNVTHTVREINGDIMTTVSIVDQLFLKYACKTNCIALY